MAFDLVLLSYTGSAQERSEGHVIVDALSTVEVIARSCEITPTCSPPSDLDTMSLEDAISSGDYSVTEFLDFCKDHGLNPNQQDEQSAAAFLDSKWGVNLVSCKMPSEQNEAKAVYRALVEFAKAHKLRIANTYTGRDVDLAAPGELPTGW